MIVTTFPGVYGDMEKYLKISRVNLQSYSKSEKVVFYKAHKWDDISLRTFSDKGSSWLYIKNEMGVWSFMQVDKTGTFVSSIAQKQKGAGSIFIITDQHQLLFKDKKLLIANEKKTSLVSSQ